MWFQFIDSHMIHSNTPSPGTPKKVHYAGNDILTSNVKTALHAKQWKYHNLLNVFTDIQNV